MKKVELDSDADVLYCPACQKYKAIKNGVYKVKLAVNGSSEDNQCKLQMYSYFSVICDGCYKKIIKPKGKEK